jgi:phage terminase Nu1 subunit (DNA packaging protein)
MANSLDLHKSTLITGIAEHQQILVTRNQAAELLSLSVAEVDNLRRAGHLIAKSYGRKVLFEPAELRRWASALPSDELR